MPAISVTLQDAIDDNAVVELQLGDYVKGNDGPKGDKGDKGDTGDVTPAAEAARDAAIAAQGAAETAATNAAASAADANGVRSDFANTTDPLKGAALVGRATVTVYNVAEFQTAKRATDLNYQVRGYHPGTTYGGGLFRYDSTIPKSSHNGGTIISPTVPWNGTQGALANFLDGVGEADPSGVGCFVRDHGYDVFVSWFGAKGDASRPSASIPDGDIIGTDDTKAVGACRDYIQEVSFQPNFFVGFWGGFRLNLEPNRAYKVVGHNPLGSTRPRNSDENPSGANYRQNWFIEGNAGFFLWEVTAEEDCFIESHEAFTRQWYRNFSVFACKAVGSMGIFYSNVANSLRNATAIHKFERVEVYHVMPSSTTNGLKYMFRYTGDNLGDRLITEQCSFNQAHTIFYSENGEAVQQGFKSTTFASYLDNGIFFHLRRHGSTFNFSAGSGFLVKGQSQTLFKTEYMSGAETGSNGTNIYMDVGGCRLECEGGKLQTLANCDFGVLTIDGVTMAAGGLPDPTSNMVIARKTGVVRIRNSHVYGRAVVGIPNTTTVAVRRAYAIKFTNCHFSLDMGKAVYVEDSGGSLVSWREAVVGAYQVPSVIIEGTDTKTATFQGLAADTNSYVFDNKFYGNIIYDTIPDVKKLLVGRHRTSSTRQYLDNTSYQVLPPYIAITSIKVTHAQVSTAIMDTLRIKVGTAQFDYTLTNNVARQQYELLMPGQTIVISDNDVFERTLATECRIGGGLWASPSFIAFLEIEWRPAMALNEITTTEVAGIRQTRIITSGAQGWIGEIRTATSGTVALTTATPTNVTSVSLPPGVHDVTGNVLFSPQAGDTMTAARVSISTTSATHAAAPEYTDVGPVSVPAAGGITATAFVQRLDLASTTTVYLVATATHAGGTLNSQGKIRAVRVRQGG